VSLLTFYAAHILGGWRSGLLFGLGIGILYGALYLLLHMEQAAMVLGSALLFAVLAAVMVLTRRVDWYAMVRSNASAS
jgi:inner membrane protein